MSGTKAGGKKAGVTNIARHGADFYKRIGTMGGAVGTTGGFAYKEPCGCELIKEEHHKARCAGTKGGQKSRRKGKK